MPSRARRGAARASLSPEVADGVVLTISSVVKFGAPLFNKGDAAGCAKLYKQTAMSIVRDANVTSDEIKAVLRDAVRESEGCIAVDDHAKAAWALRRGLERAVDLILDPPSDEPRLFRPDDAAGDDDDDARASAAAGGSSSAPAGSSSAERSGDRTPSSAALFDFAASPGLADRWRPVHDVVMGGVSDGALRPSADVRDGATFATFAGVVRTENNGGFASARASLGSGIDLSTFAGLYADVRAGDEDSEEKTFLLVVKDEECMMTQVNFKASFVPGPRSKQSSSSGGEGGWGRVKVPFTAFDRPERMGRAVARGPLTPDAVCEVGLMILKGDEKQVGAFSLDVREVGAYR
jgi:hypothetical protein